MAPEAISRGEHIGERDARRGSRTRRDCTGADAERTRACLDDSAPASNAAVEWLGHPAARGWRDACGARTGLGPAVRTGPVGCRPAAACTAA
jgi:hypothetical protein